MKTFDIKKYNYGRVLTKISKYFLRIYKLKGIEGIKKNKKIIIKNCTKIKLSGNKKNKKLLYKHTKYPGGLKKYNFYKEYKRKIELIFKSIKGMLPKNNIGKLITKKIILKT